MQERNFFLYIVIKVSGIMGFDQRRGKPFLPVPVTVMKRPITDYVSKPENVIAVSHLFSCNLHMAKYNMRLYGNKKQLQIRTNVL